MERAVLVADRNEDRRGPGFRRGLSVSSLPSAFRSFSDGDRRRLAPIWRIVQRGRVDTQLTRDGVTVAHATRTCRNLSVCWLTVDSSAPDEPGDQVWCAVAKGYAGTLFLGEARSCETEEF
jgi:hypothetical protein